MSVQNYPPAPPAPADHGNDDAPLTAEGAVGVESGSPANAAGNDLVDLLASGQWGGDGHEINAGATDANGYDGHVALALDPGVLPDIDSTLDLLTSSHHLFDVPVLDVSCVPDDTSSS